RLLGGGSLGHVLRGRGGRIRGLGLGTGLGLRRRLGGFLTGSTALLGILRGLLRRSLLQAAAVVAVLTGREFRSGGHVLGGRAGGVRVGGLRRGGSFLGRGGFLKAGSLLGSGFLGGSFAHGLEVRRGGVGLGEED